MRFILFSEGHWKALVYACLLFGSRKLIRDKMCYFRLLIKMTLSFHCFWHWQRWTKFKYIPFYSSKVIASNIFLYGCISFQWLVNRFSGFKNNRSLFSHSFGDQKLKISITGLKLRCWQGHSFSIGSSRGSVPYHSSFRWLRPWSHCFFLYV